MQYNIAGQYVILNDRPTVTVSGSRQLVFPGSRELYKLIEVHKDGFSLTLKNIRTQAI